MTTMLKKIGVNGCYRPLYLTLDDSLFRHTNYDYSNVSDLACVAELLQFGAK